MTTSATALSTVLSRSLSAPARPGGSRAQRRWPAQRLAGKRVSSPRGGERRFFVSTRVGRSVLYLYRTAVETLVLYACGLRWCLWYLRPGGPVVGAAPTAAPTPPTTPPTTTETATSTQRIPTVFLETKGEKPLLEPVVLRRPLDDGEARLENKLPEVATRARANSGPVSPPTSPDLDAATPGVEPGSLAHKSLVSFVLESAQAPEQDADLRALVEDAESALLGGGGLDPISEGVGGSYVVHTASGLPIAVFKPETEEVGASDSWVVQTEEDGAAPSSPRCLPSSGSRGVSLLTDTVRYGCTPGWGARREAAAYLLDKQCPLEFRAGVPPTAYVHLRSDSLHRGNVGSLQRWVANDGPSEDYGPSRFDKVGARNIAMLDLRILNLDRHAANVLVRQCGAELVLCPIDHGYSLPSVVTGEGPELAWDSWSACQQKLDAGSIECLRQLATPAALRPHATRCVPTTTIGAAGDCACTACS